MKIEKQESVYLHLEFVCLYMELVSCPVKGGRQGEPFTERGYMYMYLSYVPFVYLK